MLMNDGLLGESFKAKGARDDLHFYIKQMNSFVETCIKIY